MPKLTALKVKRLDKPGRYGDGEGLWLQVRGAESKSWLYRFQIGGRARQMGLGPENLIGLAEARDLAREAGRLLQKGIDPIAHREAQRADAASQVMTFCRVAEIYIDAHRAGWRNEKHAWQWGATLKGHAYPAFGDKAVGLVEVGDVMKALEPIWRTKTETATRVRGRIESVLDFAKARGWRTGENPARWRGHLQNLLPAPSRVARVEHHPALPWAQMAEFMDKLRNQKGMAARSLAFTILTASRSGEVRGACWEEVDRNRRVWTVPADRMKAGREHRVPLSDAAFSLLVELAPRGGGTPPTFVFPSGKQDKPLSNMAMMTVLRRMKLDDLTVHGFRSSFRDWCAEATDHPREVAEAALAHVLADKVEAAYRRGDMLAKRARLMEDWAAFCDGCVGVAAGGASPGTIPVAVDG